MPEYFIGNVESLSQKDQEILISVHFLREFHCNISSVFHRNSMSIVELSLSLSSSFATLKSCSMFISSAECSLYLERNISVSLELAAVRMNY